MQNREKQIEEMESILLRLDNCEEYDEIKCVGDCKKCRATQIYNAGYRKQNEWVSVDERLPNETKDFLVVLNGEDIDIRLFNSRNEPCQTYQFMLDKFLFIDYYGDFHTTDRVTHWMPLPEPPKKGGAE